MTMPESREISPDLSSPQQSERSLDTKIQELDRHYEQLAEQTPLQTSEAAIHEAEAKELADFAAHTQTALGQVPGSAEKQARPEAPKKPTLAWLMEMGQKDPKLALDALGAYVAETKDVAQVRDLLDRLDGEQGGAEIVSNLHATLTKDKKE
ncbi:MAG: hypothetical protein U0517_04525 [Candidatus Andersenbacteria bacterium]